VQISNESGIFIARRGIALFRVGEFIVGNGL